MNNLQVRNLCIKKGRTSLRSLFKFSLILLFRQYYNAIVKHFHDASPNFK